MDSTTTIWLESTCCKLQFLNMVLGLLTCLRTSTQFVKPQKVHIYKTSIKRCHVMCSMNITTHDLSWRSWYPPTQGHTLNTPPAPAQRKHRHRPPWAPPARRPAPGRTFRGLGDWTLWARTRNTLRCTEDRRGGVDCTTPKRKKENKTLRVLMEFFWIEVLESPHVKKNSENLLPKRDESLTLQTSRWPGATGEAGQLHRRPRSSRLNRRREVTWICKRIPLEYVLIYILTSNWFKVDSHLNPLAV